MLYCFRKETKNIQNIMKNVISKLDKKTYFKTEAKFSGSSGYDLFSFSKGEIYWVRKVDSSDNVDSSEFVIVKGTFDHFGDALSHNLNRNSINRYNGTYSFGIPVKKEIAKLILSYID